MRDTRSTTPTMRSSTPHYDHKHRYQQIRNKTFVSQYNTLNVTVDQIVEQCNKQGISETDCRITPSHVVVKECPFCHDTKGQASNMYKLYISIGGGAYFCHRCANQGSWFDFKAKLGGYEIVNASGVNHSSSPPPKAAGRIPQPPPSFSRGRGRGPIAQKMVKNIQDTSIKCLPMPREGLQSLYTSNLGLGLNMKAANEEMEAATNPVLKYLTEVRGINTPTLRKYGVGRAKYNFPSNDPKKQGTYESAECVTFPWIMRASEVAEQESLRDAVFTWDKRDNCDDDDNDDDIDDEVKANEDKARNTDDATDSTTTKQSEGDNEQTPAPNNDPPVLRRIKARAVQNKGWQRLDPPGGGWGLFGFHTIPTDATEIVITEGEYDAMAVFQATGLPTVSLPNGCRNLPVEVLPMMERFERVYLWMDNDAPGQEGAEKFAKKIGLNRCFIVKPKFSNNAPKDANEALQKGLDLKEMLENAERLPHDRILQFKDLREQVIHEIANPDKYVGVPVPSLPTFTSIIKGFRRGEVTVLTGPTGSGKVSIFISLMMRACCKSMMDSSKVSSPPDHLVYVFVISPM